MSDAGDSVEWLSFSRERLARLFWEYAYREGEFYLSSGKVSNYYINSKTVTLLPEGACLIAAGILEKVSKEDKSVDVIGGAALGAAPIVGALAALCYFKEDMRKVQFFIDRQKEKQYGDQKRLEGPEIQAGSRALIVDDVATTGASALEVARELKRKGCEVIKVVSLLDRKMGARELFDREGIPFNSLLTIDDLEAAGSF